MLAAAPVPVEIVNQSSGGVSPAEWVAAVLPGVVAIIVVFLGSRLTRRHQDAQWKRQVEQEDKRWRETQQFEREKWERQERRTAYAAVIAAASEYAIDAGVRVRAAQVNANSVELRRRGVEALRSLSVPVEEAALVASPEFFEALTDFLSAANLLDDVIQNSTTDHEPAEAEFGEARWRLVEIARRELGPVE